MVIYFFLIYALLIKHPKWVAVFLIVGFFGHRMTALLGIITVIIWVIFEKLSYKQLFLLVVTAFFGLAIVAFAPGLMTFHDLERLNGFLQWKIQFAPLSFVAIFGLEKISFLWLIEMILMSLFLFHYIYKIATLIISKQDKSPFLLTLFIVVIILWFPFFVIDLSGVPYRFYHSGLLLLPLIVIIPIVPLKKHPILTYCILFGLVGISLTSWKSYNPNTQDPPYGFYKKMTGKIMEISKSKQTPELIIAHKSLAEFITFDSGIDAMPWIPEYEIPVDKLYRVAYLPFPKLFSFYVQVSPDNLGGNYYYVKNSDWDLFMERLEEKESEDLYNRYIDWKNPNSIRPDYLLKNR